MVPTVVEIVVGQPNSWFLIYKLEPNCNQVSTFLPWWQAFKGKGAFWEVSMVVSLKQLSH